jgi:hypothetical protein
MKGFFSTVIITLASFALFLALAVVFTQSGMQRTNVALLDVKTVGERFNDALSFSNQSITDAIVDASYARCCASNDIGQLFTDIVSNITKYMATVPGNLSDYRVRVSYTSLSVLTSGLPLPSCTGTFTVTTSFTLNASSNASFSAATKVLPVSDTKTVTISRLGLVFSVTVSPVGQQPGTITVNNCQ